MNRNRRLHKRINFREKLMFGEGDTDLLGVSHNLSPGGICVMALDTLTPGSEININIFIETQGSYTASSNEVVSVEGKVVWVSRLTDFLYLMGIQFSKRCDRLLGIYNSRLFDS